MRLTWHLVSRQPESISCHLLVNVPFQFKNHLADRNPGSPVVEAPLSLTHTDLTTSAFIPASQASYQHTSLPLLYTPMFAQILLYKRYLIPFSRTLIASSPIFNCAALTRRW